jgi:Ser/Thr protein kinase RdoA (MazF antagonist)
VASLVGSAITPETVDAFSFDGSVVSARLLSGGHIHQSFLVTCTGGRYVLQRLNDRVFPDIEAVLTNVERVTAHLATVGRRGPRLVQTRWGGFSYSANGSTWRAFYYLEGTVERDHLRSPEDAFESARAFALYMTALADLPGPPLNTTIERFHDLPHRLDALEAMAASDVVNRRTSVGRELEWARRLGQQVNERLDAWEGQLPVRTVHNDAKLSNVRFDTASGRAACVIDLDTTMLGRPQYDVGELVRTATTRTAEDACEDAAVHFDLECLDALAEGYFSARPQLVRQEIDALSLAGPHMAVENALRFLADHLAGDRYFAIDRPDQNLDRCRTQLRLTELMLESQSEMATRFNRASHRSRPDIPPKSTLGPILP